MANQLVKFDQAQLATLDQVASECSLAKFPAPQGRCWVCLDTGTLPTHGGGSMPCPDCQQQPSVTAATSAALVQDYTEASTEAAR